MSDPKNCHYVSRFMCKHWSIGRKKKHRIAKYIELGDTALREDEIENIFAVAELNSPEIERALNVLVEDPLARHQAKLIANQNFERSDEALLRALRLFGLIQKLRYFKAEGDPRGKELDHVVELLAKTDEKLITEWAEQQDALSNLTVFRLRSNDLIFHPERGVFNIPLIYKDKRRFPGYVLAFPIHPSILIASLPPEVDVQLMAQMPLSCYSTSSSDDCKRFIVSPDIWQNHNEAYVIDEFHRLHDVCTLTEDLVASAAKLEELSIHGTLKLLSGKITQAQFEELMRHEVVAGSSLEARQDELLRRRNSLNSNDERTGQAWTYWKKAV